MKALVHQNTLLQVPFRHLIFDLLGCSQSFQSGVDVGLPITGAKGGSLRPTECNNDLLGVAILHDAVDAGNVLLDGSVGCQKDVLPEVCAIALVQSFGNLGDDLRPKRVPGNDLGDRFFG